MNAVVFKIETTDARFFSSVEPVNMGDHNLYIVRTYRRGFEDDGTVTKQIEITVKVTPAEAKSAALRAMKQLEY